MFESSAVFATDAITRYATRFTPGALVEFHKDQEIGNPFLIGHDALRPLGWTQPTAVHLEPGLTRLAGRILIPETDEDRKTLNSVQEIHSIRTAKKHQTEIEELSSLISREVVGDAQFAFKGCVAAVNPGLAQRLVPQAFDLPDRDGLVSISQLSPIGAGVFQFGDLVVFAHSFLRRSQSRRNALNQPLLSRLQHLALEGTPIRIALDPDMVGLASSSHDYFEYQYWWGPKFNDDLESIPTGVTRHEASESDRLHFAISRTEFWWHRQDHRPTFEIEELRNLPTSDAEGHFGCRYAHAFIADGDGSVTHFDGAIRAYPENLMTERLDSTIADFGRRSQYTKLWRIDSPLVIHEWKSLLSDYFIDNTLVGEYLGAPHEETRHELPPTSEGDSIISQFVPYSITPGAGLRIAISFHPLLDEPQFERQIVPLDLLIAGDQQFCVVESDAIELCKAIWRRGGEIALPEESTIISSKDMYSTLPLVTHSKDAHHESFDVTLKSIHDVVDAWHARHYDLVATFALELALDDTNLRISAVGHVEDLKTWLDAPISHIPSSTEDVPQWANGIAAWLFHNYDGRGHTGVDHLFALLMPTGVFSFNRVFVDCAETEFQWVPTDQGVHYQMQMPPSLRNVWDVMKSGDLHVAPLYPVKRSICSKCGMNYRECGHSKLMDDGVHVQIDETGAWAPFWTDRPVT